MLRKLSNNALDAVLEYIAGHAENMYICSQKPTTYNEAVNTYKLGTKASPSFTGPSAGPGGTRQLKVDAVSNGVINKNGTAAYLALTCNSQSELIAVLDLEEPRNISGESTFTVTAHYIIIGAVEDYDGGGGGGDPL